MGNPSIERLGSLHGAFVELVQIAREARAETRGSAVGRNRSASSDANEAQASQLVLVVG